MAAGARQAPARSPAAPRRRGPRTPCRARFRGRGRRAAGERTGRSLFDPTFRRDDTIHVLFEIVLSVSRRLRFLAAFACLLAGALPAEARAPVASKAAG